MSATTARRPASGATTTRWSPIAGLVLAAAGAAWLWVLLQWGDMGAMPGTMGRDPAAFDGMWTVMMAAMMLPATAPIVGIDLSLMRGIDVDPAKRTARVQGGALWSEVNRETHAHGLAVTGGAISTTGVGGYTLGGRLGWLMGPYGLAADNLIEAEVVLPSGDIVRASEEEHEDLTGRSEAAAAISGW
jgi:hypothetical protein